MSNEQDIYHEGERAAQRAAGEEREAGRNAAMVAGAVMPGAGVFLQAQRMLVAAARDDLGRPWASVVLGRPGFASSDPVGRFVMIDWTLAYSAGADALGTAPAVGAALGLLAIELSTRRRLRINGRVEAVSAARLVLRVDQAYPNCPKYIQRRVLTSAAPRTGPPASAASGGRVLPPAILDAVRAADTVFVASGHPSRGLDASHRGGRPGFVEVLDPGVLRVPDYAGNGMFNTLGNLLVDARCGLTILDFPTGVLHRLTGEAEVRFARPAPPEGSADTGRSWDFRVRGWRSTGPPVRADWEFAGYSPYNPE